MSRTIANDVLGTTERTTINQRRKGAENEVALSKWFAAWTGNEFARVPRSGGMRWKNNVDTVGDVVCTDRDFNFPFVIETKFYQTLCLKEDLGKRNKIYKFWAQVTRDNLRINNVKHRMLVVRVNGMPKDEWYIFVDCKLAVLFNSIREVYPLFSGLATEKEFIYGYASKDIKQFVNYKTLAEALKNGKKEIMQGGGCNKSAARDSNYCYACQKKAYREAHPVKAAYQGLKSGAKRRGKEFTLTLEEFEQFCIATEYIIKKGRSKDSYSIDRIDVTKGYTLDNIQVLTVSKNSKKRHLEYNDGVGFKYTPIEKETSYDDVPF